MSGLETLYTLYAAISLEFACGSERMMTVIARDVTDASRPTRQHRGLIIALRPAET